MNLVRHELGFSKTEQRFPLKGTCLAIYSRAVNAQTPLEEVLGAAFPWCASWEDELRQLFSAYVEAKQRQHVLDYDDLLLYWAQMMAEPSLAADVGERFDHVLVDEYQDTNACRPRSCWRSSRPAPASRWSATTRNRSTRFAPRRCATSSISPLRFSPRAEMITLERNYRSTQPILAAANAVIELAEERFTKNLWSDRASAERPRLVGVRDEGEQARYVAETVLAYREAGIVLKAQAVLFRASHHSAPLEIELARRNIPFVKFGGLKFLEAAHVKDVLSFLRWAENPRDRVAGFRVLQLLPGVGPATAARLLERAAAATDTLQAIDDFRSARRRRPSIGRPSARRSASWPAAAPAGRRSSTSSAAGTRRISSACYDDAVIRQADLVQLAQIASTYPSARTLSDRADARSAGRHQRRGRRAAH